MEHKMRLQDKYYNYILNGTKKIEIRLNDEKRKNIKIGDKIIFQKLSNTDEYFKVRVTKLLNYNSFLEILNDFDIEILSDKNMTYEELLSTLRTFYTKEEEKEYGVLGIMFELDN